MKKSIKIFSLLLLATTSVFARVSDGLDSEKSKTYTKTYAVGSNDKISLDNKFGEMKIATWAKNEIKVDVSITVKARTDERAQKVLDIVTIEDGKTGNEISFKTNYKEKNGSKHSDNDDDEDDNDGRHRDDNTSFKINYTVYLPANATLDASNSFGDMIVGDLDGAVVLISRFGSLTAGNLSQPKKILVQFGRKLSVIESVNGGKLSIQFSKALINKLSGEVTADFNQSHGVKIKLDNSLKKLDISNNFSEILIDAPKNLSASFNIKTSFGKFSNESSFAVGRSGDEDDRYSFRNYNYSGKAGTGTTPISVKSNFGSVTLGHDLPFDAAAYGKNKEKGKTKV